MPGKQLIYDTELGMEHIIPKHGHGQGHNEERQETESSNDVLPLEFPIQENGNSHTKRDLHNDTGDHHKGGSARSGPKNGVMQYLSIVIESHEVGCVSQDVICKPHEYAVEGGVEHENY